MLHGLCKWWLNTTLQSPVVCLLYCVFVCMPCAAQLWLELSDVVGSAAECEVSG